MQLNLIVKRQQLLWAASYTVKDLQHLLHGTGIIPLTFDKYSVNSLISCFPANFSHGFLLRGWYACLIKDLIK